MSVTRRDLARTLKERLGSTIGANEDWIAALLEVISDQVAAGERIELRGFGTFESREIQAHKTTNPVTGEAMKNPKSYTVDFRPAQAFKEKLKPKPRRKKRRG
ncbi:MAG: HU family DNA-binding protein [Vulcanimicrobiota bacterium]